MSYLVGLVVEDLVVLAAINHEPSFESEGEWTDHAIVGPRIIRWSKGVVVSNKPALFRPNHLTVLSAESHVNFHNISSSIRGFLENYELALTAGTVFLITSSLELDNGASLISLRGSKLENMRLHPCDEFVVIDDHGEFVDSYLLDEPNSRIASPSSFRDFDGLVEYYKILCIDALKISGYKPNNDDFIVFDFSINKSVYRSSESINHFISFNKT